MNMEWAVEAPSLTVEATASSTLELFDIFREEKVGIIQSDSDSYKGVRGGRLFESCKFSLKARWGEGAQKQKGQRAGQERRKRKTKRP